MKKPCTIICFLLFGINFLNAQSLRDKPKYLTSGNEVNQNLTPSNLRGGPIEYIGLGSCDSLTTSALSDNGNDGVIFELTATNDLIVQYFDALLTSGTGKVLIYYKTGTYSGFTGSLSGWTLIDSAVVNASTPGFTRIPINCNIPINNLQTVSFYITGNGTGVDMDYFDGTVEGAIAFQDANLALKEGLGVTYPLSSVFTPRVFRGTIYYCLDTPTVCNTLPSTLVAGNGNDGIMFQVKAKNLDLVIDKINPATEELLGTNLKFAVFYKRGNFVGFENDANAWTFVDSAVITSTGTNDIALGLKNLNIFVPANDSVSLYITNTVSGAGSLNYTTGTTLNALFTSDNFLEIFEGAGIEFPFGGFFTPRIFNGNIEYCFVGDTIPVSLDITTTASNPTVDASIPIAFEFGKNITGFNNLDILASNASIGALSGSGSLYTATLTFSGGGLARVVVPEAVVTDAFQNTNVADTLEIEYSPVGIDEFNNPLGYISMYNKQTELIQINAVNSNIQEVKLLSMEGKLVSETKVMSNKATISTSNLSKGIYICLVKLNNTESFRKIAIY